MTELLWQAFGHLPRMRQHFVCYMDICANMVNNYIADIFENIIYKPI